MTASTRPRSTRSLPVWAWVLPVLSVFAAAAIPAIWYYGYSAVRDATDGKLQQTITDPAAPGYEAIVEPSPTMLVFGTDRRENLVWAAIFALGTADQGGSMLLVPPETIVTSPDGDRPLAEVFDESPDYAIGGLAILGDMGFGEVQIVDPAELEALLVPLGSLEVRLADSLTESIGDGDEQEVVRPAGTSVVEPDELAEVLAWVNPGESAVNRLLRQEAVWSAWLDALAATEDPATALPGESDVGIVRYLRGLAGGSHEVRELPSAPASNPLGEVFRADGPAVRALLLEMVPFPQPAFPGDRPRVRLLDGRPDQARLLADAATLVAARAEISIIGNAGQFGAATTTIAFHTEQAEEWALALRDALGTGEVVAATSPDNVIDITVTLGQDLQ